MKVPSIDPAINSASNLISNIHSIPKTKAEALAPASASIHTSRSLEVHLRANLNDAWLVGTRDLPKCAVFLYLVDRGPVGMVERIEVLTAQLESEMLTQVHILDRGNIPLLHARPKNRSSMLTAKVSHGRDEGTG